MTDNLSIKFIFCFLVLASTFSFCRADLERRNLFDDLTIVESINKRLCYRVPLHYNHLLMGGYINMPSARIGNEGELGAGFAYVSPYHIYSARCELNYWLEVSLNYRVFKGVDDPVLTPFGFGDMSDKGANIKLAILHPEDSDYVLPGIAVGLEDFLGTKSFEASYVALTKVFAKEAMELTLGYGGKRIRGFFGGFSWMPFKNYEESWIYPLFLVAEYDATPYKDKNIEPHPDGREKKSAINFGLKWRVFDTFDLSASYIRGTAFAFSLSTFYNFGMTKGFVPKVEDPLPYRAPVVHEPISQLRPEDAFSQELAYVLKSQGFMLLKVSLTQEPLGLSTLRIHAENLAYSEEEEVRRRISYIMGSLVPDGIEAITVVIEGDGFEAQEYHFLSAWLKAFQLGGMGFYELKIHSPLLDYKALPSYAETVIFKANRPAFSFFVLPDFHSFFGSAKGKFKYAFGAAPGIEGYLANAIYYTARVGFLFVSDIDNLKDVDRLNPSQLLNVRSDIINYYKQRGLTFQELYFRKIWNLGNAFFSKLSWGWLERMYGGVAGEILYYPVNSCFAFGIEGAVVKKRTTTGFGFEKKIRRLRGFTPTYVNFIGNQAFFNLYYDWKGPDLEFRIKVGQFLARDFGVRYEVSRYFESGLRVTFWYTRTNGHDVINGSTYYDKGAMISMPLDIFYTQSSRKRFYYGMSAWLRDVGQFANTGGNLYDLINDLREY